MRLTNILTRCRAMHLIDPTVLVISIWTGCKSSSDTAGSSTNPDAAISITTTTSCTNVVASDSLTMVCIPGNTVGFNQGYAAVATPVHTVASISAFAMAKYEVKYADWLVVKTYALSNGYTFANAGVQGNAGVGTDQHPVTTINWRDAIVWCNAASQKDGLTGFY